MTQKVHNTLKNFISSNNAFCDALRQEQIYIDDNILFELIIYYFTLNKKYLDMLPINDKRIILDIINKQNFTIEGNQLYLESITIPLSYLKRIVLVLEEKIKPLQTGKVLYLHDLSTKNIKVREHNSGTPTK